MKVRDCLAMLVVFLTVSVLAGSVCGQTDALPGPKYQNLRYDENFSYLGGEAGTYKIDVDRRVYRPHRRQRQSEPGIRSDRIQLLSVALRRHYRSDL